MNKLLKFVGGILAFPLGMTIFTTNLVLLPIKYLRHWLKGYSQLSKTHWEFIKQLFKKTWEAIERGEKPTFHRYVCYMDDRQYLILLNEPTNPIIFSGFRD